MKQDPPKVHGLHLTTDETVTDAWELFFSACWDAYEVIQQRRAAKAEVEKQKELPAQEKCA